MKKLWQLDTKQRRRHRKFLNRLKRREAEGYGLFFRGGYSFRTLERLFKEGLIRVKITKWNVFFSTKYPFKELEVTTQGVEGVRRRRWGSLRPDKFN